MNPITQALQALYPDEVIEGRVFTDGKSLILRWDPSLGPQPTQEQLDIAIAAQLLRNAKEKQVFTSRKAMAAAFHALPEQVQAGHLTDYTSIEACLIRGRVAEAKKRIETMPISTAVPAEQRELLRAQFLAFFS